MEDNSPEAKAIRKANWRAKDALCKECGKNPKQNGSRRCKECSDAYKVTPLLLLS